MATGGRAVVFLSVCLLTGQLVVPVVDGSRDAENLYRDLMEPYPKFVRPVDSNDVALEVLLELKLIQLIGVVRGYWVLCLCVRQFLEKLLDSQMIVICIRFFPLVDFFAKINQHLFGDSG